MWDRQASGLTEAPDDERELILCQADVGNEQRETPGRRSNPVATSDSPESHYYPSEDVSSGRAVLEEGPNLSVSGDCTTKQPELAPGERLRWQLRGSIPRENPYQRGRLSAKLSDKTQNSGSEETVTDVGDKRCEWYGFGAGVARMPMTQGRMDDVDRYQYEGHGALRAHLSGVIVTGPTHVRWDDVFGLDKVKQALTEAVIVPLKFPQLFTGKIKAPRSILLFGPPGTGKSHIVKALATEAKKYTFFSVSAPNLVSKWLGESGKLVKMLFQRARVRRPSIVFLDQLDALCSHEFESEVTKVLMSELLAQLRRGEEGIVILCKSNIPWVLDPVILESFDKRIYTPLPDVEARIKMLKLLLENAIIEDDITPENWEDLGKKTERFSGSDMEILIQDAMMFPLRRAMVATHFRKMTSLFSPKQLMDYKVVVCASCDQGCIKHDFWTPCSPDSEGVVPMTLMDVPKNKLLEPELTMSDVLRALSVAKPSVQEEELMKIEQFLRDTDYK